MEPPSVNLTNLEALRQEIQTDIASIKSLNAVRPNQRTFFNGHTYTFSAEEKKKSLHLYLPACKELQELHPCSPEKIVGNLQHVCTKIHRDIHAITRYILVQTSATSTEDLAILRALIKQLKALNNELKKAISTNAGIAVITRDFKKQPAFSDAVQTTLKSFKALREASKAAENNISDLVQSKEERSASKPLIVRLSLEDKPKGRLDTVTEEDEEDSETYNYPDAPYIGDSAGENESTSLDDAKPTQSRAAKLVDWPEEPERVNLPSNQLKELDSLVAKKSASKKRSMTKPTKTVKPSILPSIRSSLKASPVNSWKVFTETDGRQFCLIKISETAFANIPITGKNATPLDVIKKRYGLQEGHN